LTTGGGIRMPPSVQQAQSRTRGHPCASLLPIRKLFAQSDNLRSDDGFLNYSQRFPSAKEPQQGSRCDSELLDRLCWCHNVSLGYGAAWGFVLPLFARHDGPIQFLCPVSFDHFFDQPGVFVPPTMLVLSSQAG